MPSDKENNSRQEENNSQPISPVDQTKDETKEPCDKKDETKNKIEPQRRFIKGIFSIPDLIQIGLLVVGIATLISFICNSSNQTENTLRALNQADTSMVHSDTINQRTLSIATDALQATQESNTLTGKSLALAKKTAEATEKLIRTQTRAYLGIDSVQIIRFNVDEYIRLNINIINYGATPTKKAIMRANYKIGGTGIYKIEFDSLKTYKGNFIVYPQIGFPYIFDILYKPKLNDIIEIKNGILPIYFWGKISYWDIFDNYHFIKFCYQYSSQISRFEVYGDCSETD